MLFAKTLRIIAKNICISEYTTKEISKMAEKQETQKAAKSDTVTVQFLDGTDANGKAIYREQEVGRELAESELAKPEEAPKEPKEGEVLKLRNPAWKGAKIVK